MTPRPVSTPAPVSPGLRLRAGAALAGLLLVTTGCGLSGGSAPGDSGGDGADESAEVAAEQPSVDYPEGPYTRRGISGSGNGYDSALRVNEILGHFDRTVLRLTVSPQGQEGESVIAINAFGGGVVGAHTTSPLGLWIIDPVGQRLYPPAYSDTEFVGSQISAFTVVGADYEIEAHFAPLPAGTRRISLATPGTQGIFTGVRVNNHFDQPWNPGSAPTEEAPSRWDHEPGQTITMPVSDGPVPEEGIDLYSIVEAGEQEATAGQARGGDIAPPAPYAEPAQEAVAIGNAEFTGERSYDFVLFSLRRDGAFVVAEFDLTNNGPGTVNHLYGANFGQDGVHGGRFGSFGIQDPGSGDVYRSLRIGPEGTTPATWSRSAIPTWVSRVRPTGSSCTSRPRHWRWTP
ncbi:hypothetical protein [Nocardiopsis valliformis]|uniref:hypothetical protein n=1 Tax=Nocardiopsis valliformis TaxID=239974 RepID=UPI00034C3C29|nr:hypothetical protein [Nocardiopsis valliformis]